MKTWLSSLHPAARIMLAILFIAVIAGGLFFTVFLPRIPSFAGLIDGFQTPIQIYVTAPESGAVFPANAAIRVHAEIWSEEPILSYELWVNGVQQANPPTGQTEGFPLQVEWLWTPGSEDVYSLLVKATDAEGGSSLSPTVRITASEPVGAQLFLPLEPGEDPQAAAEAAGLDPEGIALQEAQPGSPAGAFIVYDIPPVESSSPDPASAPAFDVGNIGPAQPFTRLGEIGFWLQTRMDGTAPLPEAPLLAARVEGCNTILSIQSGPGVDGIVIYRILSGAAPPDRIAYFYPDPNIIREFIIEDSHGPSTYFVSSVSPGGETPSDPVSVDISDPVCAPPESGGMQIDGENLLTPMEVDRVYLYYAISGGPWNRFPHEPQAFLTGGSNTFDISPLLNAIDPLPEGSKLNLDIWGWQNGALQNLGQLIYAPGLTEVYICSHPGECTEGLGWTTQSLLPNEEEDRTRQFQWSSSTMPVTGGIWQVSSQPFDDTFSLTPPGLVASGDAGAFSGEGAQSFWIDFGQLELGADEAASPGAAESAEPFWLLNELARVEPSPLRWSDPLTLQTPYYIRVIPVSGDTPAGPPSPSAIMYIGPAAEQGNPLVEPPPKLPDIYTVQIDSFTNIVPPYLPWGCVRIESIDEDVLRQSVSGLMQYPFLLQALNTGAAYCPSVYSGEGEPSALESFVDFATGALGWASEFYESIKNEIVNIVADVINTALPGLCEGSAEEGSTCHQLLKQGLEAGLLALGIPPEIPNVERLINDGRAYLIAELAEELGPECGAYCQEKLDEALDEVINMLADEQLAQACGNVELAHSNGREPLCLPPGVEAVPHPGSSWQPAVVNITINRPGGGEEVAPDDLSSYRMTLSLLGVNESLAGQTVVVTTSICYNDYSIFECNLQPLFLEEAPRGALFSGSLMSIPPLQPGGALSIPIYVFPTEYYLPGHLELMESVGGGSLYDDWWNFFYGAELTISASVECPDITYIGDNSYPWQTCGQGDTLQLTMPNTIWE